MLPQHTMQIPSPITYFSILSLEQYSIHHLHKSCDTFEKHYFVDLNAAEVGQKIGSREATEAAPPSNSAEELCTVCLLGLDQLLLIFVSNCKQTAASTKAIT